MSHHPEHTDTLDARVAGWQAIMADDTPDLPINAQIITGAKPVRLSVGKTHLDLSAGDVANVWLALDYLYPLIARDDHA